jgi:hypothetical protein
MQYLVYGVYNFLFLAVTLWVLFFTNTYINQLLIPAFLRRSFASEMLARFFLANLEAGVLTILVYWLNRWYTEQFISHGRRNNLAAWTAAGVTATILFVTAYFAFQIYREEL